MNVPSRPAGLPAGVTSVLLEEKAIHARLDHLAREISADYRHKDLTAVAILQGSLIFAADLLRRIPLPLQIESLQVSSYHGGTESSGVVTFPHETLPDLRGRHVLLVDDILDSGRTLHTIRERLVSHSGAASIRICVLLQKRRERAIPGITADYAAFEIDDEFVIGYGLDYRGTYRNLPYIARFDPALLG